MVGRCTASAIASASRKSFFCPLGINLFNSELSAKRLALLHELVPQAKRVAVLGDPADAANTASTLRDIDPASRAIGFQMKIYSASSSREIDAAFAVPMLAP